MDERKVIHGIFRTSHAQPNYLGVIEVTSNYQDCHRGAIIRFVVPDFSFGVFSKRTWSRNASTKASAFAQNIKKARRDSEVLQKRCKADLDFFLGSKNVSH